MPENKNLPPEVRDMLAKALYVFDNRKNPYATKWHDLPLLDKNNEVQESYKTTINILATTFMTLQDFVKEE